MVRSVLLRPVSNVAWATSLYDSQTPLTRKGIRLHSLEANSL